MTSPETPLDLNPIRDRVKAATRGPWSPGQSRARRRTVDGYRITVWGPEPTAEEIEEGATREQVAHVDYHTGVFHYPHGDAQADAEFIAHARQDVPALLAEVERLRAGNERLERDLAANEGSEDGRLVVAEAEVEKLRARLDAAHDALTRAVDDDPDEFATLESAIEWVVKHYRATVAEHDLMDKAIEAVRRLCNSYTPEPPPLFRGPGLSEHGVGFNHGTRTLAEAVLGTLKDRLDPNGDAS